MITSRIPDTWQDLQQSVAQILSDCGFNVELEKVVDLGRGQAEIDVYAEETIKGRRNLIICECKRWKSAVPQQVIHAFRTVTAEVGANAGYIISLNGFQAGAFEAIERTNVRLVTWEEFQREFEPTWLESHYSPTLTRELDPLLTYTEPLAPAWFPNLSEGEKAEYLALVEAYWPLGHLVMQFSTYSRMLRGHEPLPVLPVRQWTKQPPGLSDDVLDAVGYADLEQILLRRGRAAIVEFRVYRARAVGDDAPGED